MSSQYDKQYLELCKNFAERSRHGRLAFNTSDIELLEDDDDDDCVPESFHYIFIVGVRSDSELMWATEEENLYVSNGKIIAREDAEAYTCYEKKCKGRVYLKQNGIAYKVHEHTIAHGSMYKTYIECICREMMRQECKNAGASKSITDIYNDAVIRWNQDPKCDSPFPFPQSKVQKTLDNIRKEKYQKSPQTVDEIRNSFNNPSILSDLGTSLHRDRGVLYNYTHEEKDFSYSIFSSPKSIELICDKEVGLDVDERFFLIDATFRITPMCSVFDQTLIIHAQFGLKCFPLAVVLMSSRTTKAYQSVFEYIHKNILPLHGKGIITDFEQALRNALKSVSPETPLFGCWFHHCQALRRKVASIPELFEIIRKEAKAAEFYRKMQCLALLPADKIKDAFDQLAYDALQTYPEFAKFVDYYDKQWIRKVTPAGFSVFLLDTRTTGVAEAFNGKCGRTFKTHGSLFSFLAVYQKEELVKTNELERDIAGLIQKDTRKKKFKDRSLVIEHYSKLLNENKLRVGRFLQIMANMDNKIIIQEHEYPVLNADEIEFGNTEDSDRYIALMNPSAKDTTDASSVVFAGASSDSVTVVTQKKNTTKKKTTEKSTVLTRSKVRKLTEQQTEPQTSVPKTKKRKEISDEDSEIQSSSKRAKQSSESNETGDLSAATEEVVRLNVYFEDIFQRKIELQLTAECMMGCKRPRGTVLLPCRHQPTCNQCFVLWRIFCDQKGKNRHTFCPLCRTKVTTSIPVHCD